MWSARPYKSKIKFCMARGRIISFTYYTKTKIVTKKYYTYLDSATKTLLEIVIIISFKYKELCLIDRRIYPFFMFFDILTSIFEMKINERYEISIILYLQS